MPCCWGTAVESSRCDPTSEGQYNAYLQQMLYYGIPLGVLCSISMWLVAARLFRWKGRGEEVDVVATAMGVTMVIQLGFCSLVRRHLRPLYQKRRYLFRRVVSILRALEDREALGQPNFA